MKWINGLTRDAKDELKKEWHRWFAWYPLTIGYSGEGKNKRSIKIWLQYVQRRAKYAFHNGFFFRYEWEYKEDK